MRSKLYVTRWHVALMNIESVVTVSGQEGGNNFIRKYFADNSFVHL